MIVLSVIGCLLLAVLIFLLIPVYVRFEYRGNVLKAHARYIFLKFDFFPEEDVKKAARRAEKAAKRELKKQEKEEKKRPKEPRAIGDTIKTILTIMRSSQWGLKYILARIVFYGVKIYISVSGLDAAQTAESYGKLCAFIYPGIQLFREIFILKEPDILIAPDFLSEQSRYHIVFKARLMPIVAVIGFANAAYKYIKATLQNKKEREEIKYKDRRRNYEPAASGK